MTPNSRGAHGAPNGEQTLRIRLDGPRHIYDLANNAYLGEKRDYDARMRIDGLLCHALVPYRIEKPGLEARTRKNAGGAMTIVCGATLHPKAAAAERQVIRFTLAAPDGKEWTDFAANVISRNGAAAHTFVLPINAPAGEVTMALRKELTDIQYGRVPDRHGWLVKLR